MIGKFSQMLIKRPDSPPRFCRSILVDCWSSLIILVNIAEISSVESVPQKGIGK